MEPNFLTRTILLTSLLILLSEAASIEEVRKCYWCGPLAEQVHRSQRAPPCIPQLEQTSCDAGYSHCAIVATSPPYAESRLCVKFYQDECYSLYCNSSKTWRMICPCQGDLCNGENTDRETTAFSTLAKIEGKNKRSKRSLMETKQISANETIGLSDNQITDGTITTHTIEDFAIETTSAMSNDVTEEENNTKNVDNIVEQEESEMQGDQPAEEQKDSNEDVSTADELVTDTKVNHSKDTKIINVKTDSAPSALTTLVHIVNEKAEEIPLEVLKETESVTEVMPKLASLSTTTTIYTGISVVHMKIPDNLPPPEALLQNVTPAKVETTSTPTTMGTIETTTNNNKVETTTHSIKETVKKNIHEITNNKDEKEIKNKKNGVEQNYFISMWNLLVINVIVYLTL